MDKRKIEVLECECGHRQEVLMVGYPMEGKKNGTRWERLPVNAPACDACGRKGAWVNQHKFPFRIFTDEKALIIFDESPVGPDGRLLRGQRPPVVGFDDLPAEEQARIMKRRKAVSEERKKKSDEERAKRRSSFVIPGKSFLGLFLQRCPLRV
jgi:hypothetical protein